MYKANQTQIQELIHELALNKYQITAIPYVERGDSYWKIFKHGNTKLYQIAVIIRDMNRLWVLSEENEPAYEIRFECHFIGDFNLYMTSVKFHTIQEFETMSKDFYKSIRKYMK